MESDRKVRITRTRYNRWPWGKFVLITPATPPRFGTVIVNRYPGEVLGLVFCGPRSWRKLSWVWPVTFYAKPEKKLIAETEQHLRAEADIPRG